MYIYGPTAAREGVRASRGGFEKTSLRSVKQVVSYDGGFQESPKRLGAQWVGASTTG